MDLNKREKIGLILFSIIIITFISIMYFNNNRKNEIEVIKKDSEVQSNAVTSEKSGVKVYISGAVKKSGVYTLQEGDRVITLIELAGGFTEKADLSSVNLAMKLKDEDFIKIPELLPTTGEIPAKIANTVVQNTNGKININTADLEQLKSLPRIGDALAQRIIDYREQNGIFRDIKDINNVSGIGDKMFENLKDKISVY
jgi:competence protein ComEA